jgi:predicted dehydrogenase
MSKPKIRVGIVGAGGVGGLGGRPNSHAGGYRRCEDAELLAVADINPERLRQFGDEWEIAPEHRYSSAQAMYEKANLDVVSVTTHNFDHHHPVIEAAEAGVKVIMVEKPLAISVEWGRKMVETCEHNGSRLLVDHTRCFLPHYRRLKQMVDDGAVGEVKTITYSGARPLLHNGTHTVGYAFYFTSAEPKLVSGFLNDETVSDPGGGGMIVCEGGVVIFINCIATRRESLGDAVIAGTAGRIQFCERRGIWEHGPLVEAGEGYGTRYDFTPIPDMPQTFDLDDYFYSATRETIDCLLEDREGVSTGRDGLKALEAITAMHISHKTGAQVPLPLAEGLDHVEIRSTGQ